MNEEMLKSLTSLIDESLAELEELKKSDRFSASEIKLDGPGSGIAGKDPQGSLGKEEDEKKEDEDEEDEEEDEKGIDKAEECAKDEDEDEEEEDEKKEDNKEEMKKSLEAQSTLLKSYVDSRFEAFESKIDRITNLVQSLASSPVPSKSVGYKTLAPLAKSQDETAPLSKSEIMDRLMDLKKSNPRSVDSADIAGAEMSSGHALAKIANKYNIK